MTDPTQTDLPLEEAPGDPDAGETSLARRVIRGAGWVFAGKIVGRGLVLLKVVILARILAPEDFGLFGVALLVISALETFFQTGFDAALIQRKEDITPYLDTVWTAHIVRGLIISALIFFGAPVAAAFFERPDVAPLLRCMALFVVLRSCQNIGVIYFRKELEFHKQFIYEVVPSVLSLGAAVGVVWWVRSAWALVVSWVVLGAATCALSYVLHDYRPRLRFDGVKFRALFSYGRWLLGSSILVFIATQGDDVLVGKVLGIAALGLYQVAYRLANALRMDLSSTADMVALPAYAKIQDQRERLSRAFLNVFEMTALLTLPATVFIVMAAPQMVDGLLGEGWSAMVPVLRVLAVSCFFRIVASTAGPLVLALGKPHLAFWMNACRVGVMAVTIWPLVRRWGITGAGVSVLLGLFACMPIWAYANLLVGTTFARGMEKLIPALVFSVAVIAGVWLAALVPAATPLARFIAQTLTVGALCAMILLFGLKRKVGPFDSILRGLKSR